MNKAKHIEKRERERKKEKKSKGHISFGNHSLLGIFVRSLSDILAKGIRVANCMREGESEYVCRSMFGSNCEH